MHNAGMENLSDPNWADIANSINELANRNILMANINDMSIEAIVSKLKDNNIKVKSVLVTNIDELKSSRDYAKLESFLIASGVNIIAQMILNKEPKEHIKNSLINIKQQLKAFWGRAGY